jgi:tripartite-type tricarboxylate transporter receptor subunit TctC
MMQVDPPIRRPAGTLTRRGLLAGGAALAAAGPWAAARAQAGAWPARPLKLIVPFIPGSAPDVLARGLGERLSAALGQPVVIENRAGAGGNIGLDAIAKSAGDGYTIGLGTSSMSINPTLYRKVPWDPVQDFTPVHLTYAMPHALIVQADSPIRTVADLVRTLQAAPGKHNYASGGNGSGAHLCAELFKAMAKVDALHVPYRGAPEILTAVMGGSALFGFPTLSTAVPLVKSGKVRALGVTGPRRNPALPDVPTVGDTVAGFEVVSWFAIVAPARLPGDVTRRLDQELRRILADTAFRDKVQADGTEVVGLGHEEFATYLRQDLQKWKRAVELSGAKVD